MWFSCFPVLPGSAEAQVTWGSILKHLLIAYFIGNISAKKYQNLFMCVKVIASPRWDVILRHGVITGMLAIIINVSILNLTVAHLEQFRPPQLRDQRERPTDVRVDWKLSILYTKSPCRYLLPEAIFAASVVPKAVAMVTSLDPRFRLCLHRIAWSRKPIHR